MLHDADLLQHLRDAIDQDEAAVAALLDDHPDLVHARPWPSHDSTVLEAVAWRCVWHRPHCHRIARLLIDRGAWCHISTAARAGLLEVVQQLVTTFPETLNAKDHGGRTALYRASCVYGAFPEGDAVAAWLIDQGAEVDIWSACTLGMGERVEALLKDDPSLADQGDPDGMWPLHWAVRYRQHPECAAPVVKLLLDHGADVTRENKQEDGMQPLHHVGEWMSTPDVAELLLAAGADINPRAGQSGWTPLDYAVDRDRREMVEWLRERGGVESGRR